MNLKWFQENNIDISKSVGIDEVGRGPLAGPVVSAAVWISQELAEKLESNSKNLPVRDSKKLSHNQREKIVNWINEQSKNLIKYSIGVVSVKEIDEINIFKAAMLSMKKAYIGLKKISNDINIILVDGNQAPDFDNKNLSVRTIIKGDSKVFSISLASIIAKEYRDSIMRELSEKFPQYGWNTNVGYGTKKHIEAIETFGITEHHRKSFAPINEYTIMKKHK